MPGTVLIRGAGDLASGVAIRLFRAGLHVAMTELAQPLAVRRTVSFAEAIFRGRTSIEGVVGCKVEDVSDVPQLSALLGARQIPVLVDPQCSAAATLHPLVIVDARMGKKPPEPLEYSALMFIGLGPGFTAPLDCHAVIETERGHTMGRVIMHGSARPDSGRPDGDGRRVLRAPTEGILSSGAQIGQHFEPGDVIAEIGGEPVIAPFAGILRGLLQPGLVAESGMKIGDLDARDDPVLCELVSDKSLAVGGGVLEAILGRPDVRYKLWS
jgi:xanthine dehydrogenase accessory factor